MDFLYRLKSYVEPLANSGAKRIKRFSLDSGRTPNTKSIAYDNQREKNTEGKQVRGWAAIKRRGRGYGYGKSAVAGRHAAGSPQKGCHHVAERSGSATQQADEGLGELCGK